MIPVYNATNQLRECLASVLSQDPGSEHMQIEVVDDCSTTDVAESVLSELNSSRITYFRQKTNVGLAENWNTCIERAHGQWTHLLHQDDFVLPGFYRQFHRALAERREVGAAFCRHYYVDEEGCRQGVSPLEQAHPGVLENFLERIATLQLIQTPSIVVRKSVYEQLGGFLPELKYSLDWEMWRRIAVRFPFWYEPDVLACYRIHSSSESSRMTASGENIADTLRSIEMCRKYLPPESAGRLTLQARENYALYAVRTARQLIEKGELSAARQQLRQALRCRLTIGTVSAVIGAYGAHCLKYGRCRPNG